MEEPKKKRGPSPGDMAWLVGEALRAGGIKVQQSKEKFGSIRVYVNIPNTHRAREHYREVYLAAMRACPELTDNLRYGADYTEWLFDNEAQLDEHIARLASRSNASALELWDPRFKLARDLIRGENTDKYNTTEDEE